MRSVERRGLLLAFAAFGLFWGAWSATLPALRQQAHVSDGRLGLALAAIAVCAVPMMPLAGRLVDRFGARRMLPLTLACFGIVLPLPAFAHSFPALLALLALLGLATGALDVVVNAGSAAWERLEQDHLMSYVHGAFSVGVLVGAASAGVARQAGARPLPVLGAVAAVVLCSAATQPAYRRALGAGSPARAGRRLPLVVVALGLLTAAAFLCEDAIASWSALHLERGLGASPVVSGLGPGLFAGAMAAGRLAGGPLVRRCSGGVLVAGFGCLLVGGVLVTALAGTPAVALAGLAVAGAGTSLLAPVLFSAVGARAPAGREGSDLATVTALGYVGFVAGPPLVGAVSAASSLPTALASLALPGALVAVLGPLALRRTRVPAPPAAGARVVPAGKMGS